MRALSIRSLLSPRTRNLLLGMTAGLAFGAISMAPTAEARPPMVAESEGVKDLREEVMALSLYHALDLTAAQKKDLRALLEPYHATLASVEKASKAREASILQELETARQQLRKEGKIKPETQARLHTLHQQQQEGMAAVRAAVKPVKDGALQILTPAQQESLKAFRPAEALYGENAIQAQTEDRLDTLRGLPSERVNTRVERVERRAVTQGMSPEEAGAFGQRYRTMIEEIQAIPEDQWETQREAMAGKLDEEIVRALQMDGASGRSGRGRRSGNNSAMLLLSEPFLQMLQAR